MRKVIVEMVLDDTYDTWKSTDEQLVERLIAPTNAGVTLRLLKQCSVSGRSEQLPPCPICDFQLKPIVNEVQCGNCLMRFDADEVINRKTGFERGGFLNTIPANVSDTNN